MTAHQEQGVGDIIREPLCKVADCPYPNDEAWHRCHIPGCGKEAGDHQHVPKRSQGGKEIVAFLCRRHHEWIDAGNWGNKIISVGKQRFYYVFDPHGNCMLERPLGGDSAAQASVEAAPSAPPAPAGDLAPFQALSFATLAHPTALAVLDMLRPTELALPHSLPFESWQQLGSVLGAIRGAIQWWVGDWLNFGEDHYGEAHAQAMEATGLKFEAVSNWAWVARSVPPERRRAALSWSVHRAVAKLEPPEQETWLAKAENEGWDTERLGQEMRGGEATVALCEEHDFVCKRCGAAL